VLLQFTAKGTLTQVQAAQVASVLYTTRISVNEVVAACGLLQLFL